MRYGIMLTSQKFVDLGSLNNVIFTEYERLNAQSTRTNTPGAASNTVTTTTTDVDNMSHMAILPVDADAVPFMISTGSALQQTYPDHMRPGFSVHHVYNPCASC